MELKKEVEKRLAIQLGVSRETLRDAVRDHSEQKIWDGRNFVVIRVGRKVFSVSADLFIKNEE